MDDQHTTPGHHAILIGINAYQQKPLKGAVRDVQDIQTHLTETLDSINITILTATQSTNPELSVPIEDPWLWPTRQNIISAFEKVTASAKAGDFVYIHFSGHGTRQIPNSKSYNEATGDVALVVPTGNKEDPETYLQGRSLAYLVKALVTGGLVVTLVLDCCFSGSVYRDDPSVRFLPYDGAIGSQVPLDGRPPLDNKISDSKNRDASMPDWVINPDRYAILVACGPHEKAGEIQLENGEIHGTLSYFLLKTLKECNCLHHSHGYVYDSLRAELRRCQSRQYPVFYGSKDQGFFGCPSSGVFTNTILVNKKTDGSLEILVGQAHGISDGDQFALEPSLGGAESTSQADPVIVSVAHARTFTSDLGPLIMSPKDGPQRWRATSLTQLALRGSSIRLSSTLPHRDKWLVALKKQSLHVHSDAEKREYSLEVTLNENQEYEIRDGTGHKMINLPVMSRSQTSIEQIGDVLKHLARFRLTEGLGCGASSSAFRQSFDIHIVNEERSCSPDCPIEIKDGATAQLVIKNQGVRDIYVSIYDLGPQWQVQNINRATYTVVTPKNQECLGGMFRKKLKMTIPDGMKKEGYHSCEDIIKVLVSSHPTSFDFLELPRLVDGSVAANKGNRSGQTSKHATEDWTAINFPVRIIRQEDGDS